MAADKPPQLIVALDTPDLEALKGLISQLSGYPVLFKSHWISFPALGFAGLKQIVDKTGDRLFLDFKLHDIPHTVAHSIRAILGRIPVRLLNLHASGGPEMLEQARAEIDTYARSTEGTGLAPPPKLIAVTLLTSLSDADLATIGYRFKTRDEGVLHLARLAQQHGAHGVVCSPQEAAMLRHELGPEFVLVTPGIRPAGEDPSDHAAIATPQAARELGIDYVVVGRPIYRAPDPAAACRQMLKDLGH